MMYYIMNARNKGHSGCCTQMKATKLEGHIGRLYDLVKLFAPDKTSINVIELVEAITKSDYITRTKLVVTKTSVTFDRNVFKEAGYPIMSVTITVSEEGYMLYTTYYPATNDGRAKLIERVKNNLNDDVKSCAAWRENPSDEEEIL